MQNENNGRTKALVTGAARGIGRAVALELARDGYDVAVVDTDFAGFREFEDEQTDNVVAELAAAGARVIHAETSTTDAESVERLVARIVDEWGRLDALVCNAGGGSGPFDGNRASAIDLDELDAVLRRNLHGTITTVRAALPALVRGTDPAIVTMGSVTGVRPSEQGTYAHYGITKAAVMHYTRYLAKDLAPQGIRANCIAPGPIATARLRQRAREVSERDTARAEEILRSVGTEAEVARLARYLASPESRGMSGQIVHLHS
ncbi:SDR family oxidoreductase [Saccharopolyspora sp. NPDC050642]|uniref:SDR family NAD(P)-dependent oxidoreductase n=1 Tax=Saccharopolyspora sp. NPDC050642 TaxID=3157099 RepID=UPI003406E22E